MFAFSVQSVQIVIDRYSLFIRIRCSWREINIIQERWNQSEIVKCQENMFGERKKKGEENKSKEKKLYSACLVIHMLMLHVYMLRLLLISTLSFSSPLLTMRLRGLTYRKWHHYRSNFIHEMMTWISSPGQVLKVLKYQWTYLNCIHHS